jgi:CBS domain containing-hemolysin-like protein
LSASTSICTAGMTAQDGTWDLAVSPGLACLAAAALVVAAFGALAAACLLCYSPAKILMRLKNGRGQAAVDELQANEQEFQIVARCIDLGGLIGAFVAMESSTTGTGKVWVLLGFGLLALFFCGMLPSAIAQAEAEAPLLVVLPVLRWMRRLLLWPVVTPVRALTKGALHLLHIDGTRATDPEAIAEEVMAAVSDSVTEKALEDEERQWIGNIVTLKEQQVAAIMTPRTDVVAMPADLPLAEAVALAQKHGFSRYPVYGSKIDEVIGMFYTKDALSLALRGAANDRVAAAMPLRSIMREPFFVPETMAVAQLLQQFKQKRQQMAVVLDEYGGTAGLVSIEDVLEEIVGDIADEYDAAEEKAPPEDARITVVEAGRIVEVPGRIGVRELNQILSTGLREDGDYDTVAGLVISHLNRIPAVGETFPIDGVEFRILEADDRRLARLRVTALAPEPAEQDG